MAIRPTPPRVVELLGRTLDSSSQLPIRIAVLLIALLVWVASELGLDILLGAFVAGLVVRLANHGEQAHVIEQKLSSVAFGVFVPFFFIVSGMSFDLDALTKNPVTLLRLPLFLGLFLVVRGVPVLLLYRRDSARAQLLPMVLLSATALPLVVAITEIGLETGRMRPQNAAGARGRGHALGADLPVPGLHVAPPPSRYPRGAPPRRRPTSPPRSTKTRLTYERSGHGWRGVHRLAHGARVARRRASTSWCSTRSSTATGDAVIDAPLEVGDIADAALVATRRRGPRRRLGGALRRVQGRRRVDGATRALLREQRGRHARVCSPRSTTPASSASCSRRRARCTERRARCPVDEQHPTGPESPYGESKRIVEQMLRWFDECHGLRSVASATSTPPARRPTPASAKTTRVRSTWCRSRCRPRSAELPRPDRQRHRLPHARRLHDPRLHPRRRPRRRARARARLPRAGRRRPRSSTSGPAGARRPSR